MISYPFHQSEKIKEWISPTMAPVIYPVYETEKKRIAELACEIFEKLYSSRIGIDKSLCLEDDAKKARKIAEILYGLS